MDNSNFLIEEAARIACREHAGQVDKAGEPYILHVLRVGLAGKTPEERIVGFLHDIIEDCGYLPSDIERDGFPKDVNIAVSVLTRYSAETYEQYIFRVSKNPLAKAVKLADLADNLRPERSESLSPGQQQRYASAQYDLTR